MTAVALVVPLFDEAGRFAEYGKLLVDFVRELPAGSELVFVDDGSSDATAAMVEDLIGACGGAPVRLIRRPHEGKGAATAAGLAATTTDLAGFCDIDLSTPLDDLAAIIDAAARANVLAIGSRDVAGSRLVQPEGRIREALGRTYNRLLQAVVTPGVVDTQCGAKVASRSVWNHVLPWCHERGFAWDAEVVAVALAQGLVVKEVPVSWRHDDRSKLHVARDGAAMVAATPRIWRSARRARAGSIRAAGSLRAAGSTRAAHGRADGPNEESHWWFRSKAAFVATALRAADLDRDGWLVDVGGGGGAVTARLGWRPDRTVVVDADAAAAHRVATVHGLGATCADGVRLPLASGAAAVVTLLDVVEHVVDPVAALRDVARVVTTDGVVVITVPAHPWLWSAADDALGHRRRYTRAAVTSLVERAGLRPVTVTHVFSWLVPAMVVERRVRGRNTANLGLDRTSFAIDRLALVLTAIERRLVRRVASPVGSTILCVAVRR